MDREKMRDFCPQFNPLPDMRMLGSSNSAANKDKMSTIRTNEDEII